MANHDVSKASASSQFRAPSGRFSKKKIEAKKLRCVEAMLKAKKKGVEDDVPKNSTYKGQRVVDLFELGKNLKCSKCKSVLDLENIVAEKHLGLHSILSIACRECNITSTVHTGKVLTSNDYQLYAESNLIAVLGSIHSGIGWTATQKLLACMDIPPISNATYQRYEKLVDLAVEEAVKTAANELPTKRDS